MSKAKIGGSIVLDGEKEYKQAVAGINKDLVVLQSELKKVGSSFGNNKESIQGLTEKNKVLISQASEQSKKIDILKEALEKSKKEYGENSNKVKDWQIRLNNAETQLNKTKNEISETTDKIDKLSKETNQSSTVFGRFSSGLNSLKKSDLSGHLSKVGSAAATMGKTAAVAGAAIGAMVVAGIAGLAKMSKSAGEYADNVLTISAQTNLSTDSVQKFMYTAERTDVPLETLTKSMVKNIKSMKQAQDGSSSASEAYAKLGVSIVDAHGQLRNGETVFFEAVGALKKVGNETERDALALQLFGKSAQDLNPLIKMNSEDLKNLNLEAEASGAIISEKTLKAYGAFDDSLQKLKSVATGTKNILGGILMPVLTALATDGSNALMTFNKSLLAADGDMTKIGEAITVLVKNIVDGFFSKLPEIIKLGIDILKALIQGILTNLPLIIEGATMILNFLSKSISENTTLLSDGVVKIAMAIVKFVIDNLPILLDASIQIVVALTNGIAENIPILAPAIDQMMAGIITVIIKSLPAIAMAAFKLVFGLADGLNQAKPGAEIVMEGIGNSLVGKVDEKRTNFQSAGSNILIGINDGVESKKPWLLEKFGVLGNLIAKRFAKTLEISSPSKVFKNFGGFSAEGFGLGFEEKMESINKKMTRSINPGISINNYNTFSGVENRDGAYMLEMVNRQLGKLYGG